MAPIEKAREAIQTEQDASKAEIEALLDFQEQVSDILMDPNSSTNQSLRTSGPASLVSTPINVSTRKENPRTRILSAYRETVMAAPLADELEGDVREHMTAELGTGVADAVFARSGPTPNIIPIIDKQIEDAIGSRQLLLKHCQAEA